MTSTVTKAEVNEEILSQERKAKFPENPRTGAVFEGGMPPQVIALDRATDPVRAELETIRGLQELNPTEERAKKEIDLERQRGRIARFAMLQKSATPEQKEILKEKDALEKLKASDLLFLKRKWADLANLLLVPVWVDPTKSTNCDFIEKGEHKSFIVNFGESKQINNVIGAGDILPPTVSRVKINGVEGERKYTPRPGYYEPKTGKYLPIYDGDKLEVVKVGPVDENSLKEATDSEDKWFRERRIEDMIDNDGKALSELPEDKKLEEEAQKEIEEMKKRREKIQKLSIEEKNTFMENATTLARAIEEEYGIPWQVTVAQATLESGYGKSQLAAKDGNYFGIKWKWKSYATREVFDGKEVMINDSFRTYSGMKESFIDYAEFLIRNPRYKHAFRYAQDITPRPPYYPKNYNKEDFSPKKFIEEVISAGYATDPIYVEKVVSIWKDNRIEIV